MNLNASPEERRIAADADVPPTFLDEKKFLEERRRRLEASLHDHVEELKDRSVEIGKIALVGAGAIAGVWLTAKVVGSLVGGRKRKQTRALKGRVALTALGPGATAGDAPRPRPAAAPAPAPQQPLRSYLDQEGAPRAGAPVPPPPPEPSGPSMLQVFMESEAGRMMTNQLVAILMVFVTRKLEAVLKIDRSADIGSVKESELTPYRIVDPVSDATVVSESPADAPRPNAASADA